MGLSTDVPRWCPAPWVRPSLTRGPSPRPSGGTQCAARSPALLFPSFLSHARAVTHGQPHADARSAGSALRGPGMRRGDVVMLAMDAGYPVVDAHDRDGAYLRTHAEHMARWHGGVTA
jgi:hypothetical protein